MERLDTVKISLLSKCIYKVNAVPTQIPAVFFADVGWQADPKIHMKNQGIQNSQNNPEKKKRKLEDSCFPVSKLTTQLS